MAKKSRYNTKQRKENRSRETEYIKDLEQKIKDYDVKVSTARFFEDLPIGEKTLKGLKENAFLKMTDIQKESIPMCLKGFDVLGSAKTGSGKTLAFLIPVLEKLYRESWTEFDGLGALIISPTRELAMQIYEVLIKIGKYCSFSAGLVIGGKDVKFEMERISKMNILVGTPGRILQHMDQSVGFDTSTLQMLVLDEADRCLDMGFSKTLDSIVSNLPPSRQTLLYSATQSQSLENLARLSLTNYKTCGESLNSLVKNMTSDKDGKDNKTNQQNTPDALRQSYITVELPDKLDILYSFIKTHLKHKIIVFLSSSKQVHFVYETFRKLQPGISLMHLHGRQKQTARTDTLDKFSRAQHVVLFATDVVSRGIDFPAVDWVVQVDCPEDVDTYIHRAGRCARNGKGGDNLLMLTPQEEPGMLSRMKSKHIEPSKLNIKASKKKSIKSQLQSLLFKDPELKYLGQKAFISYIKSIYIQKDKEVFQFETLPTEDFAKSLGLPGAPKIKIKGMKSIEKAKELKNSSRQLMSLAKANDNGDLVDEKSDKPKTKIDKMFQRKNQNVLSEHYMNITKQQGDDDEEDDFMTVKRQDHELKEEELPELILPTSKRAQKKALSKKASLSTKGNPTKVRFDDEGTAHPIYELMGEEEFHKEGDVHTQKETFISKEREVLAKADIDDKELAKEKKQEKKRKRLEQMRKEMEADMSDFSDYEDDHQADGSRYDVGTGNLSDDMESDDEQAKSYKRRRFNDSPTDDESDDDDRHNVIEVEEPQTLEDLESLTAKLIQG